MAEIRIMLNDSNAGGMALAGFLLVNQLMGLLEKKGILTAEESERLVRDCEEMAGELAATAATGAEQAMAAAAAGVLRVTADAFGEP